MEQKVFVCNALPIMKDIAKFFRGEDVFADLPGYLGVIMRSFNERFKGQFLKIVLKTSKKEYDIVQKNIDEIKKLLSNNAELHCCYINDMNFNGVAERVIYVLCDMHKDILGGIISTKRVNIYYNEYKEIKVNVIRSKNAYEYNATEHLKNTEIRNTYLCKTVIFGNKFWIDFRRSRISATFQ